MLIEHKLSLSDIERDAEEHNEPILEEIVRPEDTVHLYKAKSQVRMGPLAGVVARSFFCRVFYSGKNIYFVGRESNRRAAIDLYKVLVTVLVESHKSDLKVHRHSEAYRYSSGTDLQKDIAFKNGFFLGFTRGIQYRLLDNQKALVNKSGSTAMVLVNRENADVENHLATKKLSKSRAGIRTFGSSGVTAGQTRASSVSLTSKGLL